MNRVFFPFPLCLSRYETLNPVLWSTSSLISTFFFQYVPFCTPKKKSFDIESLFICEWIIESKIPLVILIEHLKRVNLVFSINYGILVVFINNGHYVGRTRRSIEIPFWLFPYAFFFLLLKLEMKLMLGYFFPLMELHSNGGKLCARVFN